MHITLYEYIMAIDDSSSLSSGFLCKQFYVYVSVSCLCLTSVPYISGYVSLLDSFMESKVILQSLNMRGGREVWKTPKHF